MTAGQAFHGSEASAPMPHMGVCSWSLQPASPQELTAALKNVGVYAVQLALDPLRRGEWNGLATAEMLRGAGITILSGMMAMQGEDYSTLASIRLTGGVRPKATWEQNLQAGRANAVLARRLGIRLVTFHAGFLPHDSGDPEWSTMLERLGLMAQVFADEGVAVALESGQESARTLADILQELRARGRDVGINFDPANMILYGMGNPVESLRVLAPAVRQIHIKDAKASHVPGHWGEEMVVGTGEVDWPSFFRTYADAGLTCDLVIEREAGTNRCGDVKAAAELVRRLWSRQQ